MSLLTEEQIEQLVKIASVTSTVKSYHDKFCEWNEKQQLFIEPNWNRLPSKIKYCHIRHYYFDDIGNEIDWEFISNFERPVTPHPHAKMMAKYAEVAARRVDPWAEFEFEDYGVWNKCEFSMRFQTNLKYRHIGDKK